MPLWKLLQGCANFMSSAVPLFFQDLTFVAVSLYYLAISESQVLLPDLMVHTFANIYASCVTDTII